MLLYNEKSLQVKGEELVGQWSLFNFTNDSMLTDFFATILVVNQPTHHSSNRNNSYRHRKHHRNHSFVQFHFSSNRLQGNEVKSRVIKWWDNRTVCANDVRVYFMFLISSEMYIHIGNRK